MEQQPDVKIPVQLKISTCYSVCPDKNRADQAVFNTIQWRQLAGLAEQRAMVAEQRAGVAEQRYQDVAERLEMQEVEMQKRTQELLVREADVTARETQVRAEEERQQLAMATFCGDGGAQITTDDVPDVVLYGGEGQVLEPAVVDICQQNLDASRQEGSTTLEGGRRKRKIDGPASGRPIKSAKLDM